MLYILPPLALSMYVENCTNKPNHTYLCIIVQPEVQFWSHLALDGIEQSFPTWNQPWATNQSVACLGRPQVNSVSHCWAQYRIFGPGVTEIGKPWNNQI